MIATNQHLTLTTTRQNLPHLHKPQLITHAARINRSTPRHTNIQLTGRNYPLRMLTSRLAATTRRHPVGWPALVLGASRVGRVDGRRWRSRAVCFGFALGFFWGGGGSRLRCRVAVALLVTVYLNPQWCIGVMVYRCRATPVSTPVGGVDF